MSETPPIGLDFDNTLVCYDQLFHRVALEGGLIPPSVAPTKTAVRDYLRGIGQEPKWTELQGVVYGPRLLEASPYPGVPEFVDRSRKKGVPLVIVSHKTLHPIVGPPYDLHQAARQWLEHHLGDSLAAFFELTKAAKLKRIGQVGCSHYVDDLPEILTDPAFPASVQGILFDPHGHHSQSGLRSVRHFSQL